MSGAITEYLDQLDERKSLEVWQKCYSQKANLIFKMADSGSMIKANIASVLDKKFILKLDHSDVVISDQQAVSVKFNIGTEVFFTKVVIKRFMNNYYFDNSAQVIELKRRKETRYIVPKTWSQSAHIQNHSGNAKIIPCHVEDISPSGLRLETTRADAKFNPGDVLQVHFSVYKRSEIRCQAIVQFATSNDKKGFVLGLEFLKLSTMQQEKILSIVDDIIQHTVINKF